MISAGSPCVVNPSRHRARSRGRSCVHTTMLSSTFIGGRLRPKKRVNRSHRPVTGCRPRDMNPVRDRKEGESCFHPARDSPVALDATTEKTAASEVVARGCARYHSEPACTRRTKLAPDELDWPAEGELRAKDPVFANVPVAKAPCVGDGVGAQDPTDDREAVVAKVRECEEALVPGDPKYNWSRRTLENGMCPGVGIPAHVSANSGNQSGTLRHS